MGAGHDHPSCIMTAKLQDGAFKKIIHEHGDYSAPNDLTMLEESIDKTLGTKKYIGK